MDIDSWEKCINIDMEMYSQDKRLFTDRSILWENI